MAERRRGACSGHGPRLSVKPENSVGQLLAEKAKTRKEKKREEESKERKLQMAVFTLGVAALESDLAQFDPDLVSFTTSMESMTLPGDSRLSSQGQLERAVRLCMKEGLGARDVAGKFLETDPRLEKTRGLAHRGGEKAEAYITQLSIPIAYYFRRAMGHRD